MEIIVSLIFLAIIITLIITSFLTKNPVFTIGAGIILILFGLAILGTGFETIKITPPVINETSTSIDESNITHTINTYACICCVNTTTTEIDRVQYSGTPISNECDQYTIYKNVYTNTLALIIILIGAALILLSGMEFLDNRNEY